MTLTPGTRVGAYEVTAPLGAGGMGAVFRAHDPRLKRDVALKVLAAAAVHDPERQARFAREAQVLAALNHPNIAQVFGLEQAGDQHVIVMELVEGPTLADRLRSGALPVADALNTAMQIADGLEAAHDAGIVHRDLKPGNLALNDSGGVKILDFGLALARPLADDDADAAHSPTRLSARTEMGVVLGTAPYMSPEQARGKPVDRRADIWAFGCVLYEMLTGTAAFAGETITDTLAAVIGGAPDWSRLPETVPDRVHEVLRRCLEKNLRDRQRDIGDARFALAQARDELRGTGGRGPATARAAAVATTTTPLSSATRAAAWWVPATVGLVAGAALAALALWTPAPPAPPAPAPTRVTISIAPRTLALGRGSALTLSPDGRRLVFAGREQEVTRLYLRSLDAYDVIPLKGTEDGTNPFFSHDGRWVGFFADRKLKKVALDGSAPVTVADAANPRGHAWGADDTILFTSTNGAALTRVGVGGGSATTVSTLQQGELSHRWPTFVPGGTAALFTVWNDTGWEPARIVAQNLATGTRTTVIEAGGGHGRIVRGGTSDYLVFARSEGLLAARFDLTTLTIAGQPVPVGAPLVTNLSGGAHFDVAGSTLAYVPGENAETSRSLAWVSVEGRVLSSRTVPQLGREWDLSPDGRHVARTNPLGSNRNVWLEDLERGTTTQVTTSAEHFQPVWSHDGKAVFVSRGTPAGPIYRRDLASGTEIRMTAGETAKYSEDTSPDGKWLLYRSATANAGFDLWLAPLNAAGGTEPSAARALVAQPFNEVNASFSPDSTRVAYQANANGRFDIFVKLLTDAAPTQVSLAGGVSPQWSVDGRQVWYRSAADNRLMAVGVDAQGRVTSPPRVLMDVSAYENDFAVAPDGSRLLMMPLLAAERAAATIDIVFDFLQELRQKVP